MEPEAILRLGIFAGVLAAMAAWELMAPKRPLRDRKLLRWRSNLGIVLLDSLLLRLLIPLGAVGVAAWADESRFGLLHLLALPEWLAVIATIVLLDLAIYTQHVIFHAVPLLWRMHMVHHADRDIDVTTGLRFHPLEILLSMAIKMGLVALIGAPVWGVILFEVILNGMAMFNHGNVRLPYRADALLRMLFVTPDMHRVHHSVIPIETNSNYGFNLSLWDRLFGTYRAQPRRGHAGMTIGLEQFQHMPTARLTWMLGLPFTGQVGQYPKLGRRRSGAPDSRED
jgi:sterol desaturase/sphingolipid hydroxylase (fatty acid hydroxylase superfamily)